MDEIQVKLVESEDEMEAARELRVRVFVLEQKVPLEEEFDGEDEEATYAIGVLDERIVGTGRLVRRGHLSAQIGRMAVEEGARGKGVGGQTLAFLEDQATKRGIKEIVLHAQTYVTDFYKRRGYVEEGSVLIEANIKHIKMRKTL